MARRRRPWVAAALLILAACASGTDTAVTRPTAPPASDRAAVVSPVTAPDGSPAMPWAAAPVVAPPSLRTTASAYYDGAGPAPEDNSPGRPACLLLVPTALDTTTLRPVPVGRFNVFGEFVVKWSLATGTGTGLTVSVFPPGDPSDRSFFASTARITSFPDGSELRVAPAQPRSVLVRVPTENCEYELDPSADLPPAQDAGILFSSRLVFAP
jgi:hypothetical protein